MSTIRTRVPLGGAAVTVGTALLLGALGGAAGGLVGFLSWTGEWTLYSVPPAIGYLAPPAILGAIVGGLIGYALGFFAFIRPGIARANAEEAERWL